MASCVMHCWELPSLTKYGCLAPFALGLTLKVRWLMYTNEFLARGFAPSAWVCVGVWTRVREGTLERAPATACVRVCGCAYGLLCVREC
eukprot:6173474-Pleurochrysis_carterae.AAC.5